MALKTLVVTVGILGAFTLNNWNESIKAKRVEVKTLIELNNALILLKEEYVISLGYDEWASISVDTVLAYIDSKREYDENMNRYLNGALMTITVTGVNIDWLKNKGMETITSDSIKHKISGLYNIDIAAIKTVENWRGNLGREQVWQWFYPTSDGLIKPIDYNSLIQDKAFLGKVQFQKEMSGHLVNFYKTIISKIDELSADIEAEIRRLE